jgi:hypothetical protein
MGEAEAGAMKTAAMIFAVLGFGGGAIGWLMFYGLRKEALKADGDRWPVLGWMSNMPLEVRNFHGHAADLAAASTKAGIVGYVCFLVATVALAIANDDPDTAILALVFSPFVLGIFALCLLRSPSSKTGH